MARVLGVDIPNQKLTFVALQYLKGIGSFTSRQICKAVSVDPMKRAKDLTEDEISRIGVYIEKNFVVEGGLARQVASNIQRLKEIGCWRGYRHRRNLPARGQRTRTNARTRKGPRKTVANKKIAAPKG